MKEPITVYVPVSVDERLPDKDGRYCIITSAGSSVLERVYLKGSGWFFPSLEITTCPFITHWLEPQSLITLTPDEWEKVEKCIEALEKIAMPDSSFYASDVAKEALSQLNGII